MIIFDGWLMGPSKAIAVIAAVMIALLFCKIVIPIFEDKDAIFSEYQDADKGFVSNKNVFKENSKYNVRFEIFITRSPFLTSIPTLSIFKLSYFFKLSIF